MEGNASYLETENYPVGEVNGGGGVCPSQYLVDAFEMKDGLAWNQSPLYDAAKPYDNRDPGWPPSSCLIMLLSKAEK
nr:RagB/SusD family nutrient uptake outer membrane protein [Paraflavitalea speifideiaquila]